MLQRNDLGVTVTLPTVMPIVDVEPDGVIDLPTLLPGFSKVFKKDAPEHVIEADLPEVADAEVLEVAPAKTHRAKPHAE